ncbi:hypothetical protein [Paenibacillus medicaginis]|uniref:Uncharacterized protein n=1 Tax=Paenibacillus medicaginis TaxID=1470560 RepID=A0ABV5C9G3_9BACL
MDEILKVILAEIKATRAELQEFREEQAVINKLLTGDSAGIKNQLRDVRDDLKVFRRDIRDWTRNTDEKIDKIEDRLDGVRDALNH